ncbi:MAG: excinuclease ABC subunit UvrC [Neisseriaceae bacterium]|nr:excinuclease ABC subunit UvrC [Neisseriaceae bacterium]
MSSQPFDLSIFLKTLPNLPGVYRMIGNNGQVLYVGKAVNLKKRVKSYFVKNQVSPRIAIMVKQIERIEISVTRSEAEALILENNLIKSLSPKYNILFRDDKTYPYLKISSHDFPQISYYRGKLVQPHRYFGPFPTSQDIRESIDILQKVFLLRTCEDSVFQHRNRPCLLHQIHRCSAPCCQLISVQEYRSSVNQAIKFLDGHTDSLINSISKEMNEASEKLEFEKAAQLRDRIISLNAIQARQFIDSHSNDANKRIDIIALAMEDDIICVHLVSIRSNRRILDNSFFPQGIPTDNTSQSTIEAFVTQRYLGKEKPDIIISNYSLPENIIKALEQEAERKITFITHPKGERKIWLNMALTNARQAIIRNMQQTHHQRQRKEALAKIMGLDEIQRLECFDISHTQGEATVASCVVYDNDNIQPSQYRRFNIRTTNSGDDYTAMREVLTRRYTKLSTHDADAPPHPDVVVIDGGKGQVAVAVSVWQELGLDIPIIGIAKGPERKAGEEELIIPHSKETIKLPAQHPALLLLQTVRDEAHRFAITGHRKRRENVRLHSQIDDIPGVGSKRKRALIARFGSMKGITAAAVDELAKVEGISLQLAKKIYQYLHGEDN